MSTFTVSNLKTSTIAPSSADPTKTVIFDTNGATTSTSTTLDFNQTADRIVTFPDADATLLSSANIESGSQTSITHDTNPKTTAFTFSNTFSSAPAVSVSINNLSSQKKHIVVTANTVTTTSFNARVYSESVTFTSLSAAATIGTVGEYASMAIVNGVPAMSMYYNNSDDLRFVINSNASGTGSWTLYIVDTVGNVGLWTSVAEIDGNPGISYHDVTNGNLKFARNANADGSGAWTLQTVDSAAADVGEYTSLAVVDGKPAISYFDNTNNQLKFTINANADGSGAWTTQIVDTTGNTGYYTSLAVIDGNPAISYYVAGTADNLRFARNANADGSGAWTFTDIDTTGDVGQYTSLSVISNRPAVSYHDVTNGNLKFAVNANASATGAWSLQTVDSSAANVGEWTSASQIQYYTGISYYDNTNTRLKYAENKDAFGNGAWDIQVVDNAVADAGQYTTLLDVNNRPSIGYHRFTGRNLYYARVGDLDTLTYDISYTALDI